VSVIKIVQPEIAEAQHRRETFFTNEQARSLAAEIRANIEGEVRFDDGSRALYATDGSNYRQVPIGIVLPKSKDDVIATVRACRRHSAPVLSRGGGTSLAGQCCNVAVVMDFSKYMNHVLEIDPHRKLARVEPGTVLDDLRNPAQKKFDLTFGPDPATHNHCTLGGMLGNNSCGVHAQMAGKTVSNTHALDVLTYDGLRLHAGWMTDEDLEAGTRAGGRKGEIFAGIKRLRVRYADLIRQRYPNIPRRVSGYNLDELLPGEGGRFNLARALVGSEATLVTILEATLNLVHWPKQQSLVVLGYPDIYTAADAVTEILPFKPIGLEAMDHMLVENMKKKGLHTQYLHLLPEGKGWLLVQFGGETKSEADERAKELMAKLGAKPNAPKMKLYDNPAEEQHVWKTREAGLGATAFVPGEPITWEGWEDSAVPPERLGDYLRELCKLYEKHGYKGVLYGHFGQGCVHTRITFDLMSERGVRNFRAFLDDASTLVTQYGGSLSGEHGDGQSKAEFLGKMFGPELLEAFREFKSVWDPDWKMNPGKVVEPYRVDENLRLGADYHPWEPETYFRFPDDHGSFAHAALRCVGVGECRRHEGEEKNQTMCPSYMVTREEMHATRGRAHLLWEMLHGDPVRNGWRDEAVKESLDLCLSCKGCKGDCPVNVDIATYKAEFLAHYWEGRVRPRHAYAFGLIDKWARAAALWPGLVNLTTQTPGFSALAKIAAGMPMQRRIPEFAPQTFQSWFRKHRPRNRNAARVILWPDTFNNHFFPETARAAVEVLEDAGYELEVPQEHFCCGRPLYDYGFLGLARQYLRRIMIGLQPQIEAGIPIVVLEPSCASVLRDELNGLFPDDELACKLRAQVFLLSEFLNKKATHYQPPQLTRKVMLHGHCHHKTLMKMEDEICILDKMGVNHEHVNSGCCGMAGSFGFEKDKYDVSIAVGERALLPKVRGAGLSTIVIADGFSCREQIAQQTNRHALHLAEVIQMAKRGDVPDFYPESEIVEQRESAAKAARVRAGIAVTGTALAGVALWQLLRKR
jgi:FAD/FMN-containing dehydrogenase/Fe-S oxidoreductase